MFVYDTQNTDKKYTNKQHNHYKILTIDEKTIMIKTHISGQSDRKI